MVFSLSNNISPLVFSSAFAELTFETDLASVRFSLQDNSNDKNIWESTLYSYSGKIVLYDLSSLMELYMRETGSAYRAFRVVARSGNSVVFQKAWGVIFCQRRFASDVAELSTKMFLSTIHSKMSFFGSVEQVARYAVQGKDSTERLEVVYDDAAGERKVSTIVRNKGTFPKTEAVVSIVDYNKMLVDLKATRILSVMLSAGQRAFTFYYGEKPTIAFLFRNAFNVIEVAPIFGTIKRITEVSRSTATCNGIDSFYDRKETHTYEISTADLTLHQAQWIEQMCCSSEVWL